MPVEFCPHCGKHIITPDFYEGDALALCVMGADGTPKHIGRELPPDKEVCPNCGGTGLEAPEFCEVCGGKGWIED